MKGTSKNKKAKTTGGIELVSDNQFDLLEIKVLQLLRELQETKDERDRLRSDLESSQSGLSESLEGKNKELETKEQVLRRQQSVLKTKETAIQELQQALTEQREQNETLLSETRELKEELERLKTVEPENGSIDQESKDQIRYRLEKVVDKLDQLEKIIQTS